MHKQQTLHSTASFQARKDEVLEYKNLTHDNSNENTIMLILGITGTVECRWDVYTDTNSNVCKVYFTRKSAWRASHIVIRTLAGILIPPSASRLFWRTETNLF